MNFRTPLKWSLYLICICGIIFSAIVIFFLTRQQDIYKEISQESQLSINTPIRLRIPSINLDVHVEVVGRTKEGVMDVPKDPGNTGWFNAGPRPGEIGNAVIDGHSGWEFGTVFDDLHMVQIGDKVYTEDTEGNITTFIVRELRIYDQYEDAATVFYGSDGKAHLNLITCSGVWNEITETSPDRLVVFTDLVL